MTDGLTKEEYPTIECLCRNQWLIGEGALPEHSKNQHLLDFMEFYEKYHEILSWSPTRVRAPLQRILHINGMNIWPFLSVTIQYFSKTDYLLCLSFKTEDNTN